MGSLIHVSGFFVPHPQHLVDKLHNFTFSFYHSDYQRLKYSGIYMNSTTYLSRFDSVLDIVADNVNTTYPISAMLNSPYMSNMMAGVIPSSPVSTLIFSLSDSSYPALLSSLPPFNVTGNNVTGQQSQVLVLQGYFDHPGYVEGLHLISRNISCFDGSKVCVEGDYLFSFWALNEPAGVNASNSATGSSFSVWRKDILVFHSATGLIEKVYSSTQGDVLGFTFVERDLNINSTVVSSGQLLIVLSSSPEVIYYLSNNITTLLFNLTSSGYGPIGDLHLFDELIDLNGLTQFNAGDILVHLQDKRFVKLTLGSSLQQDMMNYLSELNGMSNNLTSFTFSYNKQYDCLSNPCINGGSCVDSLRGYKCICQPLYKGTDCKLRSVFNMTSLNFTELEYLVNLTNSLPGEDTIYLPSHIEPRVIYVTQSLTVGDDIIIKSSNQSAPVLLYGNLDIDGAFAFWYCNSTVSDVGFTNFSYGLGYWNSGNSFIYNCYFGKSLVNYWPSVNLVALEASVFIFHPRVNSEIRLLNSVSWTSKYVIFINGGYQKFLVTIVNNQFYSYSPASYVSRGIKLSQIARDSTVDNNDNMSITTTSTHSETQKLINHTKKYKSIHTIDFEDI